MSPGIKKTAAIAARSLMRGRPHHAQWLITRKCNYRCVGCNVWKEQDKNELSTEEIKKGLDILHKVGIVELVISGGDPLLRDDIGEILDHASKLFVTTVYDNGSMAAKKMDLLKNVDFVAISIDSLDPEKNDFIKSVPGAWKKATEAVDKLHNAGIKVSVTPTISQMNLYEIVDITNHFTSKGIPVWYCLYSYDKSTDPNQLFRIGKANDKFVITDNEAMVKLCDQLIEMKKTNHKILMTTKLLKIMQSLYQNNKRDWDCHALNNFLVVDHLGRISGCHNQNFACSIFDLSEKYKSPEFKQLQKTYNKCDQCTYLCYIFYSLYGNPSGHLSLALDQWRNAGLLLKKEKK
ncbi:MAG: radical SAM protein [Candidatus Bathyarchaeota archaeon]|nr:radical SAM protein [Candidatus Bathyarchaeota archaeon]